MVEVSVTAPMLCALRNGDSPCEDVWTRQDYREPWAHRNRAARRWKRRARRSMRRAENARFRADLHTADVEETDR